MIENKPTYEDLICKLKNLELENQKLLEENSVLKQKNNSCNDIFETIYNKSNLAVFVVDTRTGKYLQANKAAEDLTGYSQESLQKKHTFETSPIGAESRLQFSEKIVKPMFVGETIYKQPDNTEKTAMLAIMPYRDSEIIAMAYDITEIKKNDFNQLLLNQRIGREILENEEKFRIITSTAPVGIYFSDVQGNCKYVNEKWLEITGLDLNEALGTGWTHVIHPEDMEYIKQNYAGMFKTNNRNTLEYRILHKTKGVVWVQGVAKPVFDKSNKIFGLIGVITDITKLKNSQQKLIENETKLIENQIKWESLTKNTDDTIIITDQNFIIQYINNTVQPLSSNDIIGKSVFDFVIPDHHDIMHKSYNEVFSSGQPVSYETKLNVDKLNLEYKELWYITKAIPIKQNDKITGLILMATDITREKWMIKKLKDAEEKWIAITKNTDDMIQIVDKDYKIRYINKVYNLDPEKNVIGTQIFDYIKQDDWNVVKNTIDKVIETREPGQYLTSLNINAFLTPIVKLWFSVKVVPYQIEDELTGVILIASDITEQKNHEIELNNARLQAEESDRLKSAFLANMSHEIRTPMNAILGFASLLRTEDLSIEKQNKFIYLINKRGNDLLNIINDILDISKIESAQFKIIEKEANINNLMDEIYQTFTATDEFSIPKPVKISYTKSLPNNKAAFITDIDRIKQILVNLMSNAMKFTDTGTIEFGYTTENDKIKFFVKDTGIGIEKVKQDIIFDRFRQADENYTARRYGGTGLGLSIAKGILELMKGNIWVESEKGEGSAFYFEIPAKAVVQNEIIKTSAPRINYNWSSFNFLIVEDDEYNSSYLAELLSLANAKFDLAQTGKEAIEKFAENNYQFVLMDIRLPDINGLVLTNKMKEANPEIFILAQSAYASHDDKIMSLAAGCDDFIAKPIKKEEFFKKITEWIAKLNN